MGFDELVKDFMKNGADLHVSAPRQDELRGRGAGFDAAQAGTGARGKFIADEGGNSTIHPERNGLDGLGRITAGVE